MDERIARYVQHQSYTYSYFQMVETILVVFLSFVQVMFVTRILKSDIVV